MKIIRANDVMRKAGEMELEICQVDSTGVGILWEDWGRILWEYWAGIIWGSDLLFMEHWGGNITGGLEWER